MASVKEFIIASHRASNLPDILKGDSKSIKFLCQGEERRAIAYIPDTALQKVCGIALLVIFHGTLSSAKQMREIVTAYQYDVQAQKRGWITVYPDSDHMDWDDCRRHSETAARKAGRNDMLFYREVVEHFVRNYHVDPSMIYAGGWSNGAAMAIRLTHAVQKDIIFPPKAIFVHSANYPAADNLYLRTNETQNAIPALIMNGMKDPVSPFNGGAVGLRFLGWNFNRGNSLSFFESLQIFANRLRIRSVKLSMESKDSSDSGIHELHFKNDTGYTLVKGVAVKDAGHYIPLSQHNWSPRNFILGPLSTKVNGPAIVCEWLQHLPKMSTMRAAKL